MTPASCQSQGSQAHSLLFHPVLGDLGLTSLPKTSCSVHFASPGSRDGCVQGLPSGTDKLMCAPLSALFPALGIPGMLSTPGEGSPQPTMVSRGVGTCAFLHLLTCLFTCNTDPLTYTHLHTDMRNAQ